MVTSVWNVLRCANVEQHGDGVVSFAVAIVGARPTLRERAYEASVGVRAHVVVVRSRDTKRGLSSAQGACATAQEELMKMQRDPC